jgi:hypothetical protein
MRSVIELVKAADCQGLNLHWQTIADSLITRGRATLLTKFLASNATHVLYIDIGFTAWSRFPPVAE